MHVMKPFIQPSIPSTIPLNTPKTIQTPSSQVDSSLVSYALLLILNGFKSCLFLIGWLYMILVIIVIILHMFGSDINIYDSDFKSIYHSDLLIHQFYPVAQHFPTIALYTHGDTIPMVFSTPYDNNYDISKFLLPHFRIGKVLHQFERKICGPFC